LIKPLELAGLRVEREHGGAVEIVAFALIAVIVGAGIAGGPVEQTGFRIICAGEPRGCAAMLCRGAVPGLKAWFAGRRDCPEAPHMLASGRFISVQKSAYAFIAAGNAGN